MVYPNEAMHAHAAAARSFSVVLGEYLEAFERDALQKRKSLSDAVDHSNRQRRKLDTQEARVQEFYQYLVGADGSAGGAEALLKQQIEAIEGHHEAIQTLRNTLLDGPEATAAAIKAAEKNVLDTKKILDTLRADAESEHRDLEDFYLRIFGKPNPDADELRDGGLANELTARIDQLDIFEVSQRTRHQTMFEKVEAVLPCASSAGLVSAYKVLKDRFEKPIQYYTRAFYGSLAVLFFGGLAVVSDTVEIFPPSIYS